MAVGTREIAPIAGLIRASPLAASALLAGGLAVAGAPPFAVFVSEFVILKAGLAGGQQVAIGIPAFFGAAAFCAVKDPVTRMVVRLPDRDQPAVVMQASRKATLALAGRTPVHTAGVKLRRIV